MCPAITFRVDDKLVAANASTDYKKGASCGDLKNGTKATVKAKKLTDGSYLALNIEVEK